MTAWLWYFRERSSEMTKEEINQKTNLCFLLNPNISEEEKICVIEKVMATKATIVSKAALCNIITYILKQNAELKAFKQDCIKLTEDNVVMAKQRGETVIQLTKAKEIIKDYMTIAKGSHTTLCGVPEENRTIHVLKLNEKAEEFLNSEVVKK